MLQAMGWREGSGLGRKCQGITAPIEVSGDGCSLGEAGCLQVFHPAALAAEGVSWKNLCHRSKTPSAPKSSRSCLTSRMLKLGQAGLCVRP